MRADRPGCRHGGFTLLEVIVVLVIVALIATMAGTSIQRSLSNAEIKAASRDLTAALRYTRGQAIVQQKEMALEVDAGKKKYHVPGKDRTHDIPEAMEIKLVTAQSELTGERSGRIRFFPDGSSTGGRVELTAGDRKWTIVVGWLTGEVRRMEGDVDGA